MIVHFIILISVMIIGRIGVTQYASTHDVIANPAPSVSKAMAFMTFAVFVFFAAVRSDYIDSSTYLIIFYGSQPGIGNAINALFNAEHGGFAFLNSIISTIFGHDYIAYFLVMILIHIGGFITLFRKYSVDYGFTAFLFITSMEYTTLLNGMRQTTAEVLLLYVCASFFDKKIVKFFLFVAVAYTVHPSVIIWVPVYFFVHEKPWTKKMIIFFIGIAFAVLFLDSFTNILDNMTEGTDYQGYVSLFDDDDGVNILRVIFYTITPILAFIKRKELEDAPDYINVCINLSAISASIYFVGMFTSGILIGRLPLYFTMFNYVLLPYILNSNKNPNNKMLKNGIYVLYLAYFIYNMFNTSYSMYISYVLNIDLL